MKKISLTLAGLLLVPVMAAGLTGVVSLPAGAQIQSGIDQVKGTDTKSITTDNIKSSVTAIVNWVLFAVGAISVIMIVWGGIKYATSAGDSNKVTAAKNTVMYAIVGLAIAVLAFAIVNFIAGSDGLFGSGGIPGPN